jgi:predicted 3-demethylubiquinone-9 3-methyltransferase (glyoxalase superfamily)
METPGIEAMVGKILTGIFELEGYQFMALDGGPVFKINPSISFMLNFDPLIVDDAKQSLDKLWGNLSEGGTVRMPLQKYDFSEHYGWIEDRFGVNWQLILTDPEGEPRPFIIPSLMFVGDVAGKAEEAAKYYRYVFDNSKEGNISRYPEGMEPDKAGTIMFSDFLLENQWFVAMDSAQSHDFAFNEAVSLLVNCEDQEEVDRLWEALSAVPESEVCGWLKDQFGVSWQIVPDRLGELLSDPDKEKANRVMNSMLRMKKIVIADLEEAAKVS